MKKNVRKRKKVKSKPGMTTKRPGNAGKRTGQYREQKYSRLRADMWKIASESDDNPGKSMKKILAVAGPVTGACRISYNKRKGDELVCVYEWKKRGIKSSVGTSLSVKMLKRMIKGDSMTVLSPETALNKLPASVRPFAVPLLRKYAKSPDLKSVLVKTVREKGEIKEALSFDICVSGGKKEKWEAGDREIISDMANIMHIISEKYRVKKKLETGEKRFRQIFELAPDAYYLSDLKGVFTGGNRAAEKLIGSGRNKLVGRNFLKLNILPKKYILKAAENLAKNTAGRETGPDEFELIRADGRKITAEISSKPVELDGKKMILGIARNVTERKIQRRKLELDSLILDSVLDSVFVFDAEGNFIYVNEAGYKTRGYTKDEFMEMGLKNLAAEPWPEVKQRLRKIEKGGELVFESLHQKKDKSVFFVELHARLIKLSGRKFIISVARDMTERLKTETEIRNRIEELDQIFNSTTDGMRLVGTGGIVLKANTAFLDMSGKQETDIVGSACGAGISCGWCGTERCTYKKVLRKGEIREQVIEINGPAEKKYYILNAVPFKGAGGRTVGVLENFRDVTDKIKSQEVLKQSYEKLRELDVMKTNFTSMVSHELRTPLTSIKGFLALLIKGAAGEINPKQADYLETINNNAERLLKLISELLDLSKVEAGTFSVEKRPAAPVGVINNAVKEISALADKKGVIIKTDTKAEEFRAGFDEYRINQVLINLINNSIKFSPKGSTISVGAERKEYRSIKFPDYAGLPLKKEGMYLIYSVKDTGPGIDRASITRIFDRFYQGEGAGRRSYKGVGLGLYIAKSIIEAHGGTVWAESEGPGKGAAFYAAIPAE